MRNVKRDAVSKPRILGDSSIEGAMHALRTHYRLSEDRRQTRRAPLQPDLWRDQEVQLRLRELFLSKCAYCESRLAIKQIDVAIHHRPTANATGHIRVPSPDHYAWYAYEWENLLPACQQCSRSKSNHFPTEQARVEPFTSLANADRLELPLLMDPCKDPVGEHLAFEHDGTCIALSLKGKATINTLALNREDLLKERRRAFAEVSSALSVKPAKTFQVFDDLLTNFLEDSDEFAGAKSLWLDGALRRVSDRRGADTVPASVLRRRLWELSRQGDQAWAEYCRRLTTEDSTTPMAGKVQEGRSTRARRAAGIASVEITNFKGIDKLSIDFDGAQPNPHGWAPSAALLGENATGKSSILQALCLVLMGADLRTRLGIDPRLFVRTLPDGDDEDEATLETVVRVRMDTGDVNMIRVDRDGVLTQDAGPGPMLLAYGAHRFFGAEDSAPASIRKEVSVRSLFRRNLQIPHSAQWLAGIDKSAFQALARALREVLSLGPDDEISRDPSGNIVVSTHGQRMALHRMSDGYRSLFAMVLDIFRRMILEWGTLEDARGVVLIDEVELHLHPRWKMKVMSALRSALPNVQFIFTTHDPLCLRGMYDGEVHVLVRDEEGDIAELIGLPDVRAMRAEQLLTSEFFGLASTADPELFRELDDLALRGASAPADDGEDDRRFSEQLAAFDMIGDTPAHQVVNEALRRRIVEQLNSKKLDRAQVREDAVAEILQRLRAQGGGPEN
ncbi:AAA family ATPase [Roseateles noduli]|uniref:AAA family ATPase n=1 Tax=Roseateles noduli TaxID=2052484 RepID=UPI003D660FFD